MKSALLALLFGLSSVAMAFDARDLQTQAAPAVQYRRDANFIYVRQPLRLTLDAAQQAALHGGIDMISKQLTKMSGDLAQDPSGDLAAISETAKALGAKLDTLVATTGQLYGEVAPFGWRLFDSMPTALIVFTGVELNKDVFKLLQGGGSVMLGLVLVPMQEQRISIKNPSDVKTAITWDSSLIAIPAANAGPGVIVSGGGTNARAGVGIVWGSLNSAGELHGATGGGSVTLQVGAGLNLKFLALKNLDKPGTINNMILLVGLDKGQYTPGKSTVPLLKLNAESHFSLGWIYDAGSIFEGLSKFAGGVASSIAGIVN